MGAAPTGVEPELVLRLPREDEQGELRRALEGLAAEGASVSPFSAGMPFAEFCRRVEERERGVALPAGIVPSTLRFGFVGNRIVGRVSIRHTLNDALARKGGHIGYVVLPEFRRRGYATAMLRQALAVARERLRLDRVLLTCDDDNMASIRTIERNAGVLERLVTGTERGERPFRRYWIATSTGG